jgi:hypothetical protein
MILLTNQKMGFRNIKHWETGDFTFVLKYHVPREIVEQPAPTGFVLCLPLRPRHLGPVSHARMRLHEQQSCGFISGNSFL